LALYIHIKLTLLNGIEYCFRIAGDISVILCLKNAGHDWELLGKNPVIIKKKHECFYHYFVMQSLTYFMMQHDFTSK
jgi:hypothetical protein